MAKADPTLVKAAFLEAQTRAGASVPDLKPLYDSTASISGGYMKQIAGIMQMVKGKKEKERIALEKQLVDFTKIAEEGLDKLYRMKEPMSEGIINAIEKHIEELQDEFELVNTLGKNDTKENAKARRRITGELSRVVNQTIDLRKNFMTFSDQAKNMNMNRVKAGVVDPAQMMIHINKHDENIENGKLNISYGKDGIIFTARNYWGDATSQWGDEVSMTFKEIQEAFPVINKQADADYIEMVNNSTTTGIADGDKTNPVKDYKIDEQRGLFKNKIVDGDAFGDFSTRRIDLLNKLSFEEALLEDIRIPMDVLNNMFIDDNGGRMEVGAVFAKLDLNGDGFVDKGDEAMAIAMGGDALNYFEANVDNMIDAIVNPNNEAFDLQTSTSLLTDYYVGSEDGKIIGIDQQKYIDAFDKTVKENEIKENRNNPSYTGANKLINGSYVNPKDWKANYEPYINWLENPVEGESYNPPNGGRIKYENGEFWSEIQTSKDVYEWKTVPLGDIIDRDGISEHVEGGRTAPRSAGANTNNNTNNTNNAPSQRHAMDSIFTGGGGKHQATSFVSGDPMKVAAILREHFNVSTNNIYPNKKKLGGEHLEGEGDVLVFEFDTRLSPISIKTEDDVKKLMRFLNEKEWSDFIGVPVSTYE